MRVLYLHGWNAVVAGVQPTYLKSHGHQAMEPLEALLRAVEGRD